MPSRDGAIRVVRVIARMNVGGPAQHVAHLCQRLEQEYPTLLVTGSVGPGEADMLGVARERGARIEVIPELGRALRPWDDLVALTRLVRILRRHRPAIIHTHTAKAGALGRGAAALAGVPVRVHTYHGHVFDGYFSRPVTAAFVSIERALARSSDALIALSPGQAHDLVERYRIGASSRVRVLPLGLDLDRFQPPDAAGGARFRAEVGAGDRTVVTAVARLVPIKNHDLLLEAAALLSAHRSDMLFVIVGGGPEEQRLRQRAAALGIADPVRFLGWREDLEAIYAGSDIVALTSRNEGTPVCLLEALAAGCRVVATDVGGVRDVLHGGRLGALVPPADPAAFAAALEAAAAATPPDPAVSSEVRERYSVERLSADVSRLYGELLRMAG
jgi:glycosyltransferase involved in cell wall biosynthesis